MGYYTRYNGEIKLNNDRVKTLVLKILLDDSACVGDMDDWNMNLFESRLEGNKLIINEDRKNYNEEMEEILDLILHFDNKAEGEVIAEGEDGEDKERFILKDGKLFREEGYIAYKNKKDLTGSQWEYDEDLENEVERFMKIPLCESCRKEIHPKFIFNRRGYYDEIHNKFNYENICQACYNKLKEPFLKRRKLEEELKKINREITSLKSEASKN